MDEQAEGLALPAKGNLDPEMDQELPGSLLFLHGYILERMPPDPGPRRRAVVQLDAENPDKSDSANELEVTPENVREVLGDRPELLEIAKGFDGVRPVARVVVQLPDEIDDGCK